jgi:hypothetical protein
MWRRINPIGFRRCVFSFFWRERGALDLRRVDWAIAASGDVPSSASGAEVPLTFGPGAG